MTCYFPTFSFLAAITLRRNGRRASFCSQVPSFPPTPRLASPMLQVHSGHHVRPSRYGSTTREWHSPDDRDEEIAHQLRLWRFLVNPESSCSLNANANNNNNNDNNSTTWEASETTTEAFSTQKLCCRMLRVPIAFWWRAEVFPFGEIGVRDVAPVNVEKFTIRSVLLGAFKDLQPFWISFTRIWTVKLLQNWCLLFIKLQEKQRKRFLIFEQSGSFIWIAFAHQRPKLDF